MLGIVIVVLGTLAALSWVLALISATQLVRLAPRGSRLRTYGRIGWWRFADLRADLGSVADPHIRTYQRAFVAFMVCILAGMALNVLLAIEAQN